MEPFYRGPPEKGVRVPAVLRQPPGGPESQRFDLEQTPGFRMGGMQAAIYEEICALPGTTEEREWRRERLETLTVGESLFVAAARMRQKKERRSRPSGLAPSFFVMRTVMSSEAWYILPNNANMPHPDAGIDGDPDEPRFFVFIAFKGNRTQNLFRI